MTETANELAASKTPSGGWAVRVPIHGGPAQTVYQWHADRGMWCSGTDHADDSAQPACTVPVNGLTEAPTDADEARRIIAEWIDGDA